MQSCGAAVAHGDADAAVVDALELYSLEQDYGGSAAEAVRPVLAEWHAPRPARAPYACEPGCGGGGAAAAIAIARVETCQAADDDGAFTLERARGGRSCHSAYGDLASWLVPVDALRQRGLSAGATGAEVVESFFAASCAPSARGVDFCSGCANTTGCGAPDARHNDVLACLRGGADVAFLDNWTALGATEVEMAENARDFRVVCDTGCEPLERAGTVRRAQSYLVLVRQGVSWVLAAVVVRGASCRGLTLDVDPDRLEVPLPRLLPLRAQQQPARLQAGCYLQSIPLPAVIMRRLDARAQKFQSNLMAASRTLEFRKLWTPGDSSADSAGEQLFRENTRALMGVDAETAAFLGPDLVATLERLHDSGHLPGSLPLAANAFISVRQPPAVCCPPWSASFAADAGLRITCVQGDLPVRTGVHVWVMVLVPLVTLAAAIAAAGVHVARRRHRRRDLARLQPTEQKGCGIGASSSSRDSRDSNSTDSSGHGSPALPPLPPFELVFLRSPADGVHAAPDSSLEAAQERQGALRARDATAPPGQGFPPPDAPAAGGNRSQATGGRTGLLRLARSSLGCSSPVAAPFEEPEGGVQGRRVWFSPLYERDNVQGLDSKAEADVERHPGHARPVAQALPGACALSSGCRASPTFGRRAAPEIGCLDEG